jgi:hypothetical protein
LWRWIDRDRQIGDSQPLVLGQRHQDDIGIGRIEQGLILDDYRRTQLVRLLRQRVTPVRASACIRGIGRAVGSRALEGASPLFLLFLLFLQEIISDRYRYSAEILGAGNVIK